MRLIKLLVLLVVLVALFVLCLLFVVSNPTQVSTDFLVPGWHFKMAQGGLLLLVFVVGLGLGGLVQWLRLRLQRQEQAG